jgi:hydroxyacylglutathione hydrolase
LDIARFVVGPLETNCYVASCPATAQSVVIDPGLGPGRALEFIREQRLEVRYILNTHGHLDHTAGNTDAHRATGAPILAPTDDWNLILHPSEWVLGLLDLLGGYDPIDPHGDLVDGQTITFGECSLKVLATPGHTRGGICLLGEGHLFTGDTLFAGGVGRTDLPESDPAAMERSLADVLMLLPDDLVCHPGHGPETTLGDEKRSNPFLPR